MNLLVFGKSSYPINFFLNENFDKKIQIVFYEKKFNEKDILDLEKKSFYIKYFSNFENKYEVSLNFIHIHNIDPNLEIKINTELCQKLKYAFNKMQISKNIFISSVNSYKGSFTSYGVAKYSCEEVYRSMSETIIIRPSTIIEIDYSNKIVKGGRKGSSFDSLNLLMDKSYFIPVPSLGKNLQTVCFVTDLAKFLKHVIINNDFNNKTINFYSGEKISYSEFLDINFKLKKISRLKIFIPIFLISIIIFLMTKVFKTKISKKNIQNMISQKIEFDFTKEIEKFIKLKKIKNVN